MTGGAVLAIYFVAKPSLRVLSSLLGLGSFVALYLLPNPKDPANPPSVGYPDMISLRTRALRRYDGAVVGRHRGGCDSARSARAPIG